MSPKFVLDQVKGNNVLLIAGTLGALIWANIDAGSYHKIVHYGVYGKASLHFLVTEIGMAFFFGIAAKEIREAMLPGGYLGSFKKAITPLVATLGGVVGPALCYVAICTHWNLMSYISGWAIPCATDIAFVLLVARFVFGKKSPVIAFLLFLAIADDAAGLLIIAICYPVGDVNVYWLFGVFLAIGVNFFMMKKGVTKFWNYILMGGVISWMSFYFSGLHPSLALVPVIWTMPHASRDEGVFMEDNRNDTLNDFEHSIKGPTEIILFGFGLTNAGVEFSSIGAGTFLVGFSLLFGKTFGIFLSTIFGIVFFGISLPKGMNYRDLLVAGVMAGIGFTVALFVSSVAFPPGQEQSSAKMGALASFAAAGLGIAVARLLGAGRYGRKSGQ